MTNNQRDVPLLTISALHVKLNKMIATNVTPARLLRFLSLFVRSNL